MHALVDENSVSRPLRSECWEASRARPTARRSRVFRVTPHLVAQRGREFGVRVPLGASLRSLLFEVAPRNSATRAAAASTLLVFSIGAALVPAIPAARIDPLAALREE